MVYSFDSFNYLVRLDKGERLMASLERFVAETQLEGAWVSGLGSTIELTLGFYDLEKKEYRWQDFDGPREVVSLAGNLAFQDGKLIVHLHGVFGDPEFQTVGGHVKDLAAGATLELFVHRAYQPTKRKTDPETGLHILDL